MSLSDRLATVREANTFTEPTAVEDLVDVEAGTAAGDAYAAMKARASEALFDRVGARINDPSLTEEQLHGFVREELAALVDADQQLLLSADERRRLLRDVEADALGLGPLERMLADDEITEIMVNRFDQVYVERSGRLTLSNARFTSEEHLRRVIDRIVNRVGRRVDESSPLVDARLADGSRVNAVIPPLAVDGSSLTIRKFSRRPFTVTDLIGFGTMTEQMAHLLDACVQARLNILVSGGTGTGKTTLANAILDHIAQVDPDHRVVIIEDTRELQCNAPNTVFLRTSDNTDMTRLLRATMRLRPDRIVVGEVRDGSALALLKAWNTGHPGGVGTVHANSASAALIRVGQLIQEAGVPPNQELIAESVNVVVSIKRTAAGRVVEEVVAVRSWSPSGGFHVERLA